jgi:hypothetical protein
MNYRHGYDGALGESHCLKVSLAVFKSSCLDGIALNGPLCITLAHLTLLL